MGYLYHWWRRNRFGYCCRCASRGYKTILFEQHDFAKGTSSRSTKLVHGGVRYLQQGNIKLVMEALKERGLLMKNAPHLVKNQKFVVPNYKWWEGPFYGIGLKIYDWMAETGLGPSSFFPKKKHWSWLPRLIRKDCGAALFIMMANLMMRRLAIQYCTDAQQHGGVLLNYFPVTGLLKTNNKIYGVKVKDALTGKTYEIKAKAVSMQGVFTDAVMQMDDPHIKISLRPARVFTW